MITREELFELTRPFDRLPLECDGMTRMLSLILARAGVIHQPMRGVLPNGLPHRWIEVDCVEGRTIVDYRLRIWLGFSAPHGVFDPSEFTYAQVFYWQFDITGSLVLEQLCVPLPSQQMQLWTT